MKAIALSAVCVAACTVGCGQETQPRNGQVPAVAAPSVWTRPVDLTTAVGRDARPGFDVRHSGLPVGPDLATLAARLSLRTWPELVPVASSVVAQDAVPTPAANDARIDMIPSVPLGERWYALVIDDLPPRFEWPSLQTRISLPSGTLVSRFKTASAPFVASVQFCAEPAQTKVIVGFSELVLTSMATIAQATTISQPGNPDLRCTLQPPSAPLPSGPFLTGKVEHECPGLDRAGLVSISLTPSLTSATGKSMAPFSAKFVPDDLVDTGTCRLFRAAGSASDPLP